MRGKFRPGRIGADSEDDHVVFLQVALRQILADSKIQF